VKGRGDTRAAVANGGSLRGASPRDFHALCALITERRVELPRRLLQVADYAIARPQDIAFGTVVQIAKSAKVQPSTLVRFGRALGYNGFTDLQEVFKSQARQRWPDYPQRLEALRTEDDQDHSPARLLQGFARVSAESVERVASGVSAASLEQAVEILARAQTIYLLATRRSFAVTSYMAYLLRKLAVRCELVDQGAGLAPEQMELSTPRDAMLAVSFTPYAPTTLELAGAAARRKVPVVAITDSPFSPLIGSARVWFEVVEADFRGFRSLAGAITLAMTLAVAVARHRDEAKKC